MLSEIEADWKAAVNGSSRKLLHQETIGKVIRYQKVLFQFKNMDATMELELFRGDETRPPEARRYKNTLLVTNTHKALVIYPHEWKSRTDKMMAILMAFTKGRDHEDKVMLRKQQAIKRSNDAILARFRNRLEKTTFTKNEIDFTLRWLDENTNQNHVDWNNILLDGLTKYHQYITGRGLIEIGVNLGHDANRHVPRCYDLVAKCINASVRPTGGRYLPNTTANGLFLEVKDTVYSIYIVRSTFAKLWDHCFDNATVDRAGMFLYFINFLGAYYAQVTGVPLDEQCTRVHQQYIAAKNREQNRRLNGNPNPTRRFREPKHAPILSFDGMMGAAFDEAFERTKKARKPKRKEARDDFDDEDVVEAKSEAVTQPEPEEVKETEVDTPVVVVETADTPDTNDEVHEPESTGVTISDPDLPEGGDNLGVDAFDDLNRI